jgi:hypothetical protein
MAIDQRTSSSGQPSGFLTQPNPLFLYISNLGFLDLGRLNKIYQSHISCLMGMMKTQPALKHACLIVRPSFPVVTL